MGFLKFTKPLVRVRRVAGEPDGLGNPTVLEDRDEVLVAGWAAPQADEQKINGHDRIDADLNVFARPGELRNEDAVEVGGLLFEVVAVANFDNGPFDWQPGADVVSVRRVVANAPSAR